MYYDHYLYDRYRRDYFIDPRFIDYRRQNIYDSQIATNYQNIYNAGYMAGVNQVSYINQYRDYRNYRY